MTDLVISDLVLPQSLDDPDAADFIALTELSARVSADTIGSTDFSFTPAEMLPIWKRSGQTVLGIVGKLDDAVVGFGDYAAVEGAAEVFMAVTVAPEHRRNGYGSALFSRLADIAREDGRTIAQTHVAGRRGSDGPSIPSPTGIGSVPVNDPGAAFALSHGFTLEQVETISRLALPLDGLTQSPIDPDYQIVTWVGSSAPELLEDIAALMTRMSTDTPTGGLEATEDVWDAERVRDMDERFSGSPRARLTAAARHIPSGQLVAITHLDVPVETHRGVNQWTTIVLTEHRGHRLGLAVKVANLLRLQREHPDHPSVTTVNASENVHMLAVNQELGFEEIAYEGAFQRALDLTL